MHKSMYLSFKYIFLRATKLSGQFHRQTAYRYTIFYRFILEITIYKRGTNPRRPIWFA